MDARVLFLDIETSLMLVYSFGIRDQHIAHNQIADDRGGRLIHCVGMKWKGRKPFVLSEWEHGYEGMIKGTHEALCEADAVVTYNGARFDMPKLEGQFQLLGLDPPPPPTQIDLYKAARKLGHVSSKLDYIADTLGVGTKVKHSGFQLWVDTFNGCPKAQKKMATYCAGDVRLTERVYNELRPYIRNHPHLSTKGRGVCGSCGSPRLEARGLHHTKSTYAQRFVCQKCHSWSLGPRRNIHREEAA